MMKSYMTKSAKTPRQGLLCIHPWKDFMCSNVWPPCAGAYSWKPRAYCQGDWLGVPLVSCQTT